MAQDVYNVQIGDPVAWKLDGLLINFDDNNADLLATGCNLSYARNLTSTFPINTNKRLIISGIPQGSLTIGSIIGPIGDLKAFLDRYADVCNINRNVITIRPGGITPCEGDDTNFKFLKLTLTGCLIQSFGLTVENRDGMGMVNSTIAMQFVGLQTENTND